jgi:hypothetical protein
MEISNKHIKTLIRESLIKEGFFDFFKGLGAVDKKESQALTTSKLSFDASNDPWVNLELALSTIPTIIAARYAPGGEETVTSNAVDIIRPRIARHLDFDQDGAIGDKDDILISFEKLNQIDAEFVEGESVPSNQVAIDFCKSVKGVGRYLSNFFTSPNTSDINKLKQVFNSYLENQTEINSSFFADSLNDVTESIIEKNIKSLIGIAIKNNPNSFTFVADDEIEPSKGVLTFPFQISLLVQSGNQNNIPVSSFKVDCELNFTDIYRQLDNQQIMNGPLLDINFSWKIKVQRTLSTIPNIATIPVSVSNLNRPDLFKFISGLDKLANDIVTLSNPFSEEDARKFIIFGPADQNRETWSKIIRYAEKPESLHNDKTAYLADAEIKAKATNKLLSAIKHLKSEQGNLFKSLRSYRNDDYKAYKTAKRMVAVMEDIPKMGYSSQADFVLFDYAQKLKNFIEAYDYSKTYESNYDPRAEEEIKEFIAYVLKNNQKINQDIRKQIDVLQGKLNESVSRLILKRVKQRLKM